MEQKHLFKQTVNGYEVVDFSTTWDKKIMNMIDQIKTFFTTL